MSFSEFLHTFECLEESVMTKCKACDGWCSRSFAKEHVGLCSWCFQDFKSEIDAYVDDQFTSEEDYAQQMQERGE